MADYTISKHFAKIIVGTILLTTLIVSNLYVNVVIYHPVSPGPDQLEYIQSGIQYHNDGKVYWKAPLYSIWLSVFYYLGGKSLRLTYVCEKLISVLILTALLGIIGCLLLDIRSAVLLALWIVNCKYLISEPNNSHTLAAVLYLFSFLVVLFWGPAIRMQVASILLFLSAMVRSEMWLVVASIMVPLLVGGIGRYIFSAKLSLSWKVAVSWLVSILIIIGLWSYFYAHRGNQEKYDLISEAFLQNYAANYVERYELSGTYKDPWGSAHEIASISMPGVKTLGNAILQYPRQFTAHAIYNTCIAIKALPSIVLGVYDFRVLITLLLIYFTSFQVKSDNFNVLGELDAKSREIIALWIVAPFALLVNIIIFRAAARYFIQMLPSLLLLIVMLLKCFAKQITRNIFYSIR